MKPPCCIFGAGALKCKECFIWEWCGEVKTPDLKIQVCKITYILMLLKYYNPLFSKSIPTSSTLIHIYFFPRFSKQLLSKHAAQLWFATSLLFTSMMGSTQEEGIIPRFCNEMFESVSSIEKGVSLNDR